MKYSDFVKRLGASAGFACLVLAPAAGMAGPAELPSDTAVAVHLPQGLCTTDERLQAPLYKKIAERRDFPRLLDYMLSTCPDLAVGLADLATASIGERPHNGEGGEHPKRPTVKDDEGGEVVTDDGGTDHGGDDEGDDGKDDTHHDDGDDKDEGHHHTGGHHHHSGHHHHHSSGHHADDNAPKEKDACEGASCDAPEDSDVEA